MYVNVRSEVFTQVPYALILILTPEVPLLFGAIAFVRVGEMGWGCCDALFFPCIEADGVTWKKQIYVNMQEAVHCTVYAKHWHKLHLKKKKCWNKLLNQLLGELKNY